MLVLLCLTLLRGPPPGGPGPRYTFVELGTLGGTMSTGAALNDAGDVVGESMRDGSGWPHAFLYSDGRLTDVHPKGAGSSWSAGLGLNNVGELVGSARHDDGYFGGFGLHRRNSRTGLFRLPPNAWPFLPHRDGSLWSKATAVNDSGEVTGEATTGRRGTGRRAFLWSEGLTRDLGTFGGMASGARAINASGWVVGHAQRANHDRRAFLYRGGSLHEIPTGVGQSDARDVNDAGDVVGDAVSRRGLRHAFLYSRGRVTDLGVFGRDDCSSAYGINNRWQTVGSSDGDTLTGWRERAVLWQGRRIYDLNQLCAGNGAHFEEARAINEGAQILANGTNARGERRAFLLSPVETH